MTQLELGLLDEPALTPPSPPPPRTRNAIMPRPDGPSPPINERSLIPVPWRRPWQDYIFFVGSLLFIIALVPALFVAAKPPMVTAAVTAAVLYVFSFTYITMKFKLSAAVTAVTATIWLLLALGVTL